MPQARFSVRLPRETWIRDLTTDHPDATFRVVTTLAGDETGAALVELVADDPVPIVADLERSDDVTDVELLWKHGDEALLQITATDPVLLVPVREAGVPLDTPFEIRDGETTWETTTSDARLASFGEHLDELGIDFDVRYVRRTDSGETERLLTDRQHEVLLAAVEQGYYRRPRTATLTEVAESLGVTKATTSDILQRAEGKIIDEFVARSTAGR